MAVRKKQLEGARGKAGGLKTLLTKAASLVDGR
jgi:succinyl-CoA synthetase beta subunit